MISAVEGRPASTPVLVLVHLWQCAIAAVVLPAWCVLAAGMFLDVRLALGDLVHRVVVGEVDPFWGYLLFCISSACCVVGVAWLLLVTVVAGRWRSAVGAELFRRMRGGEKDFRWVWFAGVSVAGTSLPSLGVWFGQWTAALFLDLWRSGVMSDPVPLAWCWAGASFVLMSVLVVLGRLPMSVRSVVRNAGSPAAVGAS